MKRNVLVLASAQAMMMTGGALLIATSALVGQRLAPDPALATLPLALQMLAGMLTSIPASLIMQRIGRRGGFLIGNFIGLLGAILATWAIVSGSFSLFALGAALSGVFAGFGNYYRFAAADSASEEYRSAAVSYVLAGGVVAALVGPNLAHWTHEWFAAPFAGSYLALAMILMLSMLTITRLNIPKLPASALANPGRPLTAIARQPVFIVAALGGMFGYGTMSLVMTATPLAMHAHHFVFGDTALVIEWHVLAMFAPSFFTGHIIRRFGILPVMLTGALLNAACVAVNLNGTTLGHFWLSLFLLGLGWNFLFIGATTLLTEAYAPEEKARAQALNDFLVFSTVTLAALSAGSLQHQLGWRAVNLGVIPLIVVTAAAVLWLWTVRRRTITSPATL
ncbi:MAG: MFS transporter [Gammaproteobacteria bacterium]|nr:MFS transporter [Gammaproteobacteria bacterium]